MISSYRISKYDPLFRDESWSYTKEERTSYSDIWKIINAKKITIEEYKKFENLMIESIVKIGIIKLFGWYFN